MPKITKIRRTFEFDKVLVSVNNAADLMTKKVEQYSHTDDLDVL